jgi:hypothetical protein
MEHLFYSVGVFCLWQDKERCVAHRRCRLLHLRNLVEGLPACSADRLRPQSRPRKDALRGRCLGDGARIVFLYYMEIFDGDSFVFQGFEIPSDSPLFLSVLSIHVLAGLTCVVAGAIAMLANKQRGRHSKAGSVYYWVLWVVFITAVLMAIFRWSHVYHLFFLGVASFLSAVIGRMSIRQKWNKWSIIHNIGMGVSYIFLLIAFYVDNGKFLPVWKNFHPLVYWLLPPVVGVPIIIWTMFRHPLSKHYFKR